MVDTCACASVLDKCATCACARVLTNGVGQFQLLSIDVLVLDMVLGSSSQLLTIDVLAA